MNAMLPNMNNFPQDGHRAGNIGTNQKLKMTRIKQTLSRHYSEFHTGVWWVGRVPTFFSCFRL